jgi:hypothetical protein
MTGICWAIIITWAIFRWYDSLGVVHDKKTHKTIQQYMEVYREEKTHRNPV